MITSEERDQMIENIHNAKAKLLEDYGIMGGGMEVNFLHKKYNEKLESLGMDEYGVLMPYDEWKKENK